MGKSKQQDAVLFQERNRSQSSTGNLVNPSVVKNVTILDTTKATILPTGIPPRPKSKPSRTATKLQAVSSQAVAPSEILSPQTFSPQSLLRYHLIGESGWKTVLGFKNTTEVQPIHIVKDSKVHSLVVSSQIGSIPKCTIIIICSSETETKMTKIIIKENVEGSLIITPGNKLSSVEYGEDFIFTSGSSLSVKIEEENNLDLELYLQ